MLLLEISEDESWDEEKEIFVSPEKPCKIALEHSLVSIAKWESRWCKPFLSEEDKTEEEMVDYVRCMTLTQNVDPKVYTRLNATHFKKIKEYIESPMTATWFSGDKKGKRGREQVTAEIIYYWMIALNIPPDYQKWHLNRLLTLIRVCSIKNQPPKKMSKREILSQNAALNAARRKKLGTRG